MPAERVAMRRVRELLRLSLGADVPIREMARRIGIAPSTVRATMDRFTAAGLSLALARGDNGRWSRRGPVPADAGTKQGYRRRPEPDWAHVHRELKRKHVTLPLLWDEYIAAQSGRLPLQPLLRPLPRWEGQAPRHDAPDAHRRRQAVRRLCRRHRAGDRRPAHRRGARGADLRRRPGRVDFTYAEATWTQALADWIGAHVARLRGDRRRAALLVPDNAKVAVIKACLYEPQVNRTYAEMAAHYDTAVLPARPRKPRDKAKVEAGRADRRALDSRPLRHRPSTALAELNAAIRELLVRLNERAFHPPPRRHPPATVRRARPAGAEAFADEPYVLAEWRAAPGRHRLPCRGRPPLLQRPLSPRARARSRSRLTARTVEIFRGERIAVHRAVSGNGKHTTVPEHMPSWHRRYADWTVDRIRAEAGRIGASTLRCAT